MSRRRRWTHADADGGGGAGPQYDFTSGALPSGVTFTRASIAWGFNSAGVLTQYATDVPRFVSDPVTLTPLGILIEGPRTNSMPNNTMVGAVAGTPGTAPTGMSMTSTANAVTRTIVGIGTEDGIDYIDVQYAGTPSASSGPVMAGLSSATSVAAANAQVWTNSTYVRLIGGSLTNVTALAINVLERDGAGAALAGSNLPFTPTSAALRTQRYAITRTFNNASTAFAFNYITFNYTLGNAIDITLRLGLPQLEQGEGVSSTVKTSTVAVTRAADTANITDARVLTDLCYVVKGRAAPYNAATIAQVLFHIDDGGNTNRNYIQRSIGSTLNVLCAPGVVNMSMGALADNADFALATRYATDNFAASINGGAVVTDVAGTLPVGVTTARVGRAISAGGQYWNSTIKSIETRPTATNAELQALSVP